MYSGLRAIFHWKYANWTIALAWGTGVSAAFADKFILAYVFLFLSALYSMGCWVTSDTFTRKFLTTSLLYLPNGYRRGRTNNFRAVMIPTLAIVVFFFACLYWVRNLQIEKELESLQGWLYPAEEKVDIHCPQLQPNDLVLMCGSNSYIARRFPLAAIEFNCEKILTIDRDVNGRVAASITIRDKGGKVIVDLDHGQFTVNRNNYLKIDRQGSRSTLIVTDQYKQEVLYLHLANSSVLQFRAMFYYRGIPIRIDEVHPFGNFRNNTFTGSCFGPALEANVQIGECLVR
jgi:hypothetical protein